MKKTLKTVMLLIGCFNLFGQAPIIQGDVMLCPDTSGTALVTNQTYDTYQWYTKFWFTGDPFVAVAGATSASFTYDWFTFDQSLVKVVATIGGVSFESATIQIDSYAWSGLTTFVDVSGNATFDSSSGTFLLCDGGTVNASINNPPYSSVQWYKDGQMISGATAATYTIAVPGNYTVSAAPAFCPNSISSALVGNVAWGTNCSLGIDKAVSPNSITIYPNPASNEITVSANNNDFEIANIAIYNLSGQKVLDTQLQKINIAVLSKGNYMLKIIDKDGRLYSKKLLKE